MSLDLPTLNLLTKQPLVALYECVVDKTRKARYKYCPFTTWVQSFRGHLNRFHYIVLFWERRGWSERDSFNAECKTFCQRMAAVCTTPKISSDYELWDGLQEKKLCSFTVSVFFNNSQWSAWKFFEWGRELLQSSDSRNIPLTNMWCSLQTQLWWIKIWSNTKSDSYKVKPLFTDFFFAHILPPKLNMWEFSWDQFIIYHEWKLSIPTQLLCWKMEMDVSISLASSCHDDPLLQNIKGFPFSCTASSVAFALGTERAPKY